MDVCVLKWGCCCMVIKKFRFFIVLLAVVASLESSIRLPTCLCWNNKQKTTQEFSSIQLEYDNCEVKAQQWYRELQSGESLRDFFLKKRDEAIYPLREKLFTSINSITGWSRIFIVQQLKKLGKRWQASLSFSFCCTRSTLFKDKALYEKKIKEIIEEDCTITFIETDQAIIKCIAYRQLYFKKLNIIIYINHDDLNRYNFSSQARIGAIVHESIHGRDMANMEVSFEHMICLLDSIDIADNKGNKIFIPKEDLAEFTCINEEYTDILGAATSLENGKAIVCTMQAMYDNFQDSTGSTHPKASLRIENSQAVCRLHELIKKNPKK
ncbi:MAG: hypothetical protein ACJAZS_000182 [Alteromonas naphthalenivorans]|jgi:hypothetical protein